MESDCALQVNIDIDISVTMPPRTIYVIIKKIKKIQRIYHRNVSWFIILNRNLLRTRPVCTPAKNLQQIGVHEHVTGVHARQSAHGRELRDEVTINFVDLVDDARDVVVAFGPVGTNLLVAEMLHELKS